jgi:sugar lactone lactonase YvrE
VFITFLAVICRPIVSSADVAYRSYTFDSTGNLIYTQASYVPNAVIDGNNIPGHQPFAEPEDLFVDKQDRLYVADTLNGRVVVFDKYGGYIRTIGSGILQQPTGVFVDSRGQIYVADPGNQAVYKFRADGKLLKTYTRPTSPIFGPNAPYVPKKVAVDGQGNILVVSDGSVQGLIELDQDGQFETYFGGNRAGFDLLRYLQRIFFTKAQLQQLQTVLPTSPTNVAVDSDGLIYTATSGLYSQAIKRLNVSGDNLLPANMPTDLTVDDITIDRMGNIFAVDSVYGLVFEYDPDGNLITAFGGLDNGNERMGLFKAPCAIAVSSDEKLYVLDKERNNIQVFRPTAYEGLVHKATSLYLDGKYVQSIHPWTEVLRLNSMLSLAHQGIGMAEFKQGEYQSALSEFRIAVDKNDYSNTYWELRRQWLMQHLSTAIGVLIGLLTLFYILRRLHRRFGFGQPVVDALTRVARVKLVAELLYVFRVMRHPVDGFYDLKVDRKGSLTSATVLLVLYFLADLCGIYGTNFLFSSVDLNDVSIVQELNRTCIPVFAWVISNYLVSTIHDGEGRLRDVYIGTMYALSPIIVFAVPLALLSQGLTNMELVLYNFAHDAVLIWTGVLLFVMLKETHGYELGETVKNVFLTIIGMLIMGLLAFILFGLSSQLWDFITSIFQEVMIRV